MSAHAVRNAELVETREQGLPFAILKPVTTTPRPDVTFHIQVDKVSHLTDLIRKLKESSVVAIDLETRGGDPSNPESEPVGIGFAHDFGLDYVDLTTISPDLGVREYLFNSITELDNLIAHNVYFDGAYIFREAGCHPKWKACTYGLLMQLAGEGFPGQKWGLKYAQTNLLGWTETNEVGLDNWLIGNGYVAGSYSSSLCVVDDDSQDELNRKLTRIGELLRDPDRSDKLRPKKSEMWRAPADILGYYCAMDCEATYQLHERVLAPALGEFPALETYHAREFLVNTEILIEQKLRGIRVDVDRLHDHAAFLRREMAEISEYFRAHPAVSPFIQELEKGLEQEHRDREPTRYLKGKAKPKEPAKWKKLKAPGTEPPQYRKDGEQSKVWEKWKEKADHYEECRGKILSLSWKRWDERVKSGQYDRQVISRNWLTWEGKLHQILEGKLPQYRFNINSNKQIQWLLYHRLFQWREVRPFVNAKKRGSFELHQPHKEPGSYVELDYTESGQLPTNETALRQMGDVGEILCDYNDRAKELSYVESYIQKARNNGEYSTIHPGFRVPGTVTGRLAGKDPNIQQVPKTRGTLECFIPREGYVWVDCDHTSLENVVLAELSGDRKLMELYGPDAKPHDAYLFNGAQLPVVGPLIQKHYDIENPTPEMRAAAKKNCKKERDICKKVTLSKNYGIGVKKLHRDLSLMGVDITMEDTRAIHSGFDELYSGIQDWNVDLYEQWRVNGGYVLNGIGRPMAVYEGVTKDLVNRVCQSTGHDIHMMYVRILDDLFRSYNVEVHPIIIDFHDQSIVECREEDAELVARIMGSDAYLELNEELGGVIPLSGDAQIVSNLADAKLEE